MVMNVSIIGLGYVCLSLSVLLAQKFKVHAVDIDRNKFAMVAAGKSPIHYPDISSFLEGDALDTHGLSTRERDQSGVF